MTDLIEKTEDEISAECLRVLSLNKWTTSVRRVPIVAMAPSCAPDNWTYGVIDPRLDPRAARVAHRLITDIAEKWSLKE
jgi:hypothetical protein